MFFNCIFFSVALLPCLSYASKRYGFSSRPLSCGDVPSYLETNQKKLVRLADKKQLQEALYILIPALETLKIKRLWIEYEPWWYDEKGKLNAYYIDLSKMHVYSYNTGASQGRGAIQTTTMLALCMSYRYSDESPYFALVFNYSSIAEESMEHKVRSDAPKVDFKLSSKPVTCPEAYENQSKTVNLLNSPQVFEKAIRFLRNLKDESVKEVWIEYHPWTYLDDGRLKAYYMKLPEFAPRKYFYSPDNDELAEGRLKHALYVHIYALSKAQSMAAIESPHRSQTQFIPKLKSIQPPSKSLESIRTQPRDASTQVIAGNQPSTEQPSPAIHLTKMRKSETDINATTRQMYEAIAPVTSDRKLGKPRRRGTTKRFSRSQSSLNLEKVHLRKEPSKSKDKSNTGAAICSQCSGTTSELSVFTPCGHRFCPSCFNVVSKCPICRADIKGISHNV